LPLNILRLTLSSIFYNENAANEVRRRFEIINKTDQHNCVWTDKSLQKDYAIAHCMPFARWPNNDLWNLLPSDVTANSQKSDRLPTETKMKNAKSRITDWWSYAWLAPVAGSLERREGSPEPKKMNDSQHFFAEANMALPGLNPENNSVDDLFEALLLQRGRLKEMQ
jgi:hypothetical protein